MEIILADAAGFCFGVQRALEKTLQTAKENSNGPIYTLGPLIHNPQVVAELEAKGIRVAKQSGDIDTGVVIVRCHGVPPKVIHQLEERELTVVDATCPFVRRAMCWAKQLKDEGYQVVIVGDKSHPEVKAIYGASDETAWIVETPRTINELPVAKRIGVIAQTTQSTANFGACVSQFIGKTEELKAFNTICTATEQRQSSAEEIAAKVDIMVVIGGHNSANTQRLVEVCQTSGAKQTYHIETADQLQSSWFVGVNKVGVTAGASTPNWLIEGVIKRMDEFTEDKTASAQVEEEKQIETVEGEEIVPTEVAEEIVPIVETEPEEEEAMEDYPDVPTPVADTVIKGRVVKISSDEVLVDIGYKSEGHIPTNELGIFGDSKPEDVVAVGDEISVWVISVDDAEGTVMLSKKRADAGVAWEELEAVFEQGSIMEAKVNQTVKGGLLVDVGVRGFIPASQVSRNFVEELEKYVGQTLKLKIVELDRQKNNVVFSHKAVLDEEYANAKEEAFSQLEEKSIVEGVVRRLTDFGAFVDIGNGVEGLLHVSEMAHGRVKHPSDVLSEGDQIKVMVLGVDKERERISLGLKQTLANPWDSINERYQVSDTVTGTVTRVVDFGAFVKLEEGVEGLIHISQLSHRHIAKADEVVASDDQVDVKIISLDPKARRIGLSIKELEPKPEQAVAKPGGAGKPRGQNRQKQPMEFNSGGNEEMTTTLGDMFGDLFKK